MSETVTVVLPLPEGVKPTALDDVKGQYVTVLAFGRAYLGQVTEARLGDVEPDRLWLGLEIREPEEDVVPAPEFHAGTPAPYKATHINCEHDPAGINMEHAMVCDGPQA